MMDVFLVDDNIVSLFASRYCLQREKTVNKVTVCQGVTDALEHAAANSDSVRTTSVIFLNIDIEEFLRERSKIAVFAKKRLKGQIKIFVIADRNTLKIIENKNSVVDGLFPRPMMGDTIQKALESIKEQ
ncbi:hypothetical protein [Euzebyella saccharophila]|uniref:Response regulatory domain-containing protein n=1 Tax=Euzebyella saccharophila TaxID=679664 RepID=A0ABV8JQS6_9FLAO|nr:hypothetical protein [Euzebyella saccharophila]